jgi:hypothetical protein
MKNKTIRPNRLISSDLHPLIYQVIAGLTLWLVVSVWVFFGAGDYSELTFAVVSVFFFIIVAIPYILWRVWRRESGTSQDHESFRAWVAGDFETWQGRQKEHQRGRGNPLAHHRGCFRDDGIRDRSAFRQHDSAELRINSNSVSRSGWLILAFPEVSPLVQMELVELAMLGADPAHGAGRRAHHHGIGLDHVAAETHPAQE